MAAEESLNEGEIAAQSMKPRECFCRFACVLLEYASRRLFLKAAEFSVPLSLNKRVPTNQEAAPSYPSNHHAITPQDAAMRP